MEQRNNEVLPLVQVVKGQEALGRTMSCVSDPQTSAMEALKEPNLQLFSDLLSEPGASSTGGDSSSALDVNKAYPEEKQKTLLHVAVEDGNLEAVKMLAAAGADPNLQNRLTGQTPLHVLAAKRPSAQCAKVLLAMGSDVNAVASGSGKTALHFLVRKCLEGESAHEAMECLRLVVETRVELDRADNSGGQTPLYLAAKADTAHSNYLPVLTCLLSHGADWSLKCAAETNTIREIIKAKISRQDFSALEEQVAAGLELGGYQTLASAVRDSLVGLINEAEMQQSPENLAAFRSALTSALPADLCSGNVGQPTPLQRAAELGLVQHVELLLDAGADAAHFAPGTLPAALASARRGHADVLRTLVQRCTGNSLLTPRDPQTGATLLHCVLRRPMAGGLSLAHRDMEERYEECLKVLLENSSLEGELKKIVNCADELGNTALHYATQLWPQSTTVRRLLELGANVGVKNALKEVPVESILPETMGAFLDEFCLEEAKKSGDPTNRDFCVKIKYDFLAPPRDPQEVEHDMHRKLGPKNRVRVHGWTNNTGEMEVAGHDGEKDPEGQKDDDAGKPTEESNVPLPETEVLWYMSQSKKHRHLLQHPVIASFLWLKWHRISSKYNKNLAAYLAFVVAVTAYIFALYGGASTALRCTSHKSDLKKNDTGGGAPTDSVSTAFETVLWYVTVILLGLLALREVVQFGVAPRRYFFSFENLLEVTLIILTAFLLFYDDGGQQGCPLSPKRHAAAVVLVLAWCEWVTMVARHPRLSTYNIYVTMFYRVLCTFIMFLAWYSFFIFAFAMGFYILLHDRDPEPDRYHFFDGFGLSVVKTFTMFVGELEFSDLPMDNSIGGYAFLLAFVFLIVVVMMNLLNGLAVSDTGVIREEAELNSYVSQVEVISYIESMLLGDPFNLLSAWPTFVWLRKFPTCSPGGALLRLPPVRKLFHVLTGAQNILLFYDYLPDKSVTFYPNHEPDLCGCFGSNASDSQGNESGAAVAFFPPNISDAVKAVVLAKRSKSSQEAEGTNIEERLSKTEKALAEISAQNEQMVKMLEKIQLKLDKRY